MADKVMYLRVEELWRLSNACRPIQDAFGGHMVWLVGSVLTRPDYRDVDLRVILNDSEYIRLFKSTESNMAGMQTGLTEQFRMLLQTAISAMLRENTRLPLIFRFNGRQEIANDIRQAIQLDCAYLEGYPIPVNGLMAITPTTEQLENSLRWWIALGSGLDSKFVSFLENSNSKPAHNDPLRFTLLFD